VTQRRDIIFPAALVLLLFAGYVKGSPLLAWIPVDLTALGTALVLIFSVASVFRTRGRLPKGFGWVFILALAMVLPIRNAGTTEYAETKVHLLIVTGTCLIGAMLILTSREMVWWFLRWLAVGGVCVTLIAQYGPHAYLYGRISTAGGGTIGFGRATGIGLVAVAILLLARRVPRVVGIVAAALLAYSLMGSGSRGPLVAAGVAILLFVVSRRSGHRIRDLFLVTGVGVVGVLWSFNQASTFTQDRIMLLFASGDQGASIDTRKQIFHVAAQQALSHPFGIGWGNLEPLVQPLSYPHDIVLEVFAEGGWLPGLLLVGALVAGFRRTLRRGDEPVAVAAAAVLAFFLVNALVSGDINDNRALFAALGLALVIPEMLPPAPVRAAPSSGTDRRPLTARSSRDRSLPVLR